MESFNKKQKLIIVLVFTLMIIFIGYYIMQKTKQYDTPDISNYIYLEEVELNNRETNEDIVIHITGSVNTEGIIKIEYGSRLIDVIDKAGGIRSDADLSKVNLAYVVQDGQKIYIPSINDNISDLRDFEEQNIITDDINEEIVLNNNYSNSKVNINKATQAELETLNGIGPSTALKIIKYRKENGDFKKTEDLMQIPGIGESKYNNIMNEICV